MNDEDRMFTSEDVGVVRHVVQRILVPCVFVIGLLGNSVSIYVLTRRRMRCTTNIYLTALAITDIIYLTMALLLSMQHYDYVKRHFEPYWMSYGVFVWLCDACAYISIYIAMCFTIERFIAIRYPLKRQTFCTESLAKKVISGVALFCLLSTISTAFEHQYRTEYKMIDIYTQKPCNISAVVHPDDNPIGFEDFSSLDLSMEKQLDMWQGSGAGFESNLLAMPDPQHKLDRQLNQNADDEDVGTRKFPLNFDVESRLRRSTGNDQQQQEAERSANIPNEMISFEGARLDSDFRQDSVSSREKLNAKRQVPEDGESGTDDEDNMDEEVKSDANSLENSSNLTQNCRNMTVFRNGFSSLGENETYTIIWYYFTLIVFVLVPLFVLVTFNCFLILLVRKSKNLRGDLTNANSIRKGRKEKKSHSSTVSQENRVTVTLIAVVLLFIICQLPWAMYLIVVAHVDIDHNLQAILGNIFNFLAALNAAANFFLYCVLSDKYRKTIRELITGYKYRKTRNTLHSASVYTNATVNGSRRYRHTSSSVIIK